eukprot:m.91777 g.91777  ORF g.91777 m.91777 type:complete len:113 (-) comp26499_c0_seq1:47-385(-)
MWFPRSIVFAMITVISMVAMSMADNSTVTRTSTTSTVTTATLPQGKPSSHATEGIIIGVSLPLVMVALVICFIYYGDKGYRVENSADHDNRRIYKKVARANTQAYELEDKLV